MAMRGCVFVWGQRVGSVLALCVCKVFSLPLCRRNEAARCLPRGERAAHSCITSAPAPGPSAPRAGHGAEPQGVGDAGGAGRAAGGAHHAARPRLRRPLSAACRPARPCSGLAPSLGAPCPHGGRGPPAWPWSSLCGWLLMRPGSARCRAAIEILVLCTCSDDQRTPHLLRPRGLFPLFALWRATTSTGLSVNANPTPAAWPVL